MKHIYLRFTIFIFAVFAVFSCSSEKAPKVQSNRLPSEYELFKIFDDYPALRTAFNSVDEWVVNDLLNDALSCNVRELRDLMNLSGELPEIETDILVMIREVVSRVIDQDMIDDPPINPYDEYSLGYADNFFNFYDKVADATDAYTGERLNLADPLIAVYRKFIGYLLDKYPGEELEYILYDLVGTFKENDGGTTVSSFLELYDRTLSKLLLEANDSMWLTSDGKLVTEKGSIKKNGKTDTRLGNAARGVESLLSGLNEVLQDEVASEYLFNAYSAYGDLISSEGFKEAFKNFIINVEDYFTKGGEIYEDIDLGKFYHTDDDMEYVNAELGNNLKELVPMMNLMLIRGGNTGSIVNQEVYPLELFSKGLHQMELDIENLNIEETIYRCIRYDDRYRDRLNSSDDPMDEKYASGMTAIEKLLWFLSFANNLGFKPAGSADAEYIDPNVPCDDDFHYTQNRGHGEPTGGIMTINDFLYSVGSATTEELIMQMMPNMIKALGLGPFAPYIKNLMAVDYFQNLTMKMVDMKLQGKELNVFGMCFDIAAGHNVIRKSALQPGAGDDEWAGQFSAKDCYYTWPGDMGYKPGTEKWNELLNDPLNIKYPYYCSTPSYAFNAAGGYGVIGDLGTPWGGRFFRDDEIGIETPWQNPDHNEDGLPDNQGMYIPYAKDGLGTVDTVSWMMGFMARACWSGTGPYYYAPEKAGKDPEIDEDGRYVYYCPNGEVYARIDKSDNAWITDCDKYKECNYKSLWNSDFFILKMEDMDGVMRYYTYDASLFHNGQARKESGLGPSICDKYGNPIYDTDYDTECDPTDSKKGGKCNPDYYLFTYDPDCDSDDDDCNPTLDISKCGKPIEMGREGYGDFLECIYENNPHYDPTNKRAPKKPEDIVAGAVPCTEFVPGVINSGTDNEETVTNEDRECASHEEAMFKNMKWVLYEKHFMMPLPLPVHMNIPGMMESKLCGWIVMECNGVLALMKARKTPSTWVDETDHSQGYNNDGNGRWLIDGGWGYSDKPGDFRIVAMQMGNETRMIIPWPVSLLTGKNISLKNVLDSAALYNYVVGFGSMMSDVMSTNGKVLESMLFLNRDAIDSILDLPSATYGPDSPFWDDRNGIAPLLLSFLGVLHDDAKTNPDISNPDKKYMFPFTGNCFEALSRGLMPLLAKPLAYYQKKGGGAPYNTWKPRLKPPYEGYQHSSWDYLRPGPSLDMRWWNGTVPVEEKFTWVDAEITDSPAVDSDGNEYPMGFFPYGGAEIFFEPLGLRTFISILSESDPKKCDGILTLLKDVPLITKILMFVKEMGDSRFDDPEGADDEDYTTWGARRKILYGLEQMYTTVKPTKGELFVEQETLGDGNYAGLNLVKWEHLFADDGIRDVDISLDEIIDELVGSDENGKGLAVYPDHREKDHPGYLEGYSWDNFEKLADALGALLGSKGSEGNTYNMVPDIIEYTKTLLAGVKADDTDIRGLRHTLGMLFSYYDEEVGRYEYPGEMARYLTELLPDMYDVFVGNNDDVLKILRALMKEDGALEYFLYSLDSKYSGREIFEDLYAFLDTSLISDPQSPLWEDFVELPDYLVEVFDACLNRDSAQKEILGGGILRAEK